MRHATARTTRPAGRKPARTESAEFQRSDTPRNSCTRWNHAGTLAPTPSSHTPSTRAHRTHREAQQQTAFAYARVSNQEQLEQVVAARSMERCVSDRAAHTPRELAHGASQRQGKKSNAASRERNALFGIHRSQYKLRDETRHRQQALLGQRVSGASVRAAG